MNVEEGAAGTMSTSGDPLVEEDEDDDDALDDELERCFAEKVPSLSPRFC